MQCSVAQRCNGPKDAANSASATPTHSAKPVELSSSNSRLLCRPPAALLSTCACLKDLGGLKKQPGRVASSPLAPISRTTTSTLLKRWC